jgi:PleD family two-component response regulator
MEAIVMGKPIIIAIDDQQFICDAIKNMLQDTYEVRTFTSGKEALNYLSDNSVDLVLLDYEMPHMTGYEVLIAIRTNQYNKKIPVIFLTAETNERMRMEMIERGASDYICKPINSSALHQSIRKQLSGGI